MVTIQGLENAYNPIPYLCACRIQIPFGGYFFSLAPLTNKKLCLFEFAWVQVLNGAF